MPHFTLPIDQKGPVLNAVVGVSQARFTLLSSIGQAVPDPKVVRGLVDTGASCTCVDPQVLGELGIQPSGKTSMLTPSTGSAPVIVDQYDVSLAVYKSYDEVPCTISDLPVVESELRASQGFDVLIGRDFLSRCILHYNGATGIFTLAF